MKVLSFIFCIFVLLFQWFLFFYAPLEKTLGVVQKIFYFHMPLAWWSFVAFFFVFVFSLLFLIKKDLNFFSLAGIFGEIGVLFSTLMLLTGIFWARASWNTWWTWDPRLTTAFIMWFSYTIYLMLKNSQYDKQRILASCLGIVAFLDVPLVFLAARLWRSIHPSVFSAKGGIDPKMEVVLFLSFIVWGILFFLLVFIRIRILKTEEYVIKRVYESF